MNLRLVCKWSPVRGVCKRGFCSAKDKDPFAVAVVTEFGAPLAVRECVRRLKPEPRQVLVRVASAGVNQADWNLVNGLHHLKPATPFVPGFELAGEVMEVGSAVERFGRCDRVLGLKTVGTGAFAEQCLVDEDELYPIPHSMDFELAASLPVAYGTAYLALRKVFKIKENDLVLVLTSRGSSGLAAIDLAQNLFRCRVIAATESEEKCAVVRPMGVLSTVEYTDESLLKKVRKCSQGAGVDLVIDTVGGEFFKTALECLKPGGHFCSLGFSSGETPTVSMQDLTRLRATVSGIWLGGLAQQNPPLFQEIIQKIIDLVDEQYISPHIAARRPLAQINEALSDISDRVSLGKTVLTLR